MSANRLHKSQSVERFRVFMNKDRDGHKKKRKESNPEEQADDLESAYKATNWQYHERYINFKVRGTKEIITEDEESILFVSVKKQETKEKGGSKKNILENDENLNKESAVSKAKNPNWDNAEFNFEIWKSEERAKVLFLESFIGIEVIVAKKSKKNPIASFMIPARILQADNKSYDLSFPLHQIKSSETKEHIWGEVPDNMSPSNFCIVCGQTKLKMNATKYCQCGHYIHTACIGVKTTIGCKQPMKGSIQISYRCDEKLIVPLPHYRDFIKCLLDKDYADVVELLMKSASSEDKNECLKTYLEVLAACSIIDVSHPVEFLARVTEVEIKNPKTTIQTLFRGNSVASKALDGYYRIIGQSYLHTVLCPVVSLIITENANCEISPTLETDDSKRLDNLCNLLRYIEIVFTRITSSNEIFPEDLSTVFISMRENISIKFPDNQNAVYSILNSFVFLRYIVTALCSPKKHGLCQLIPPEKVEQATRNLALVSKAIQAVASMVLFGAKEPYLEVLNPQINKMIPIMKSFIDSLSLPSQNKINDHVIKSMTCHCENKEIVKELDGEAFAKLLSHLIQLLQRARSTAYANKLVINDEDNMGRNMEIFFMTIDSLMTDYGVNTPNFGRRKSYLANHVEKLNKKDSGS